MLIPKIPKRMLPHRVTVERATIGKDSRGGKTETWAAIASDVPCFRQPQNVADSPLSQLRDGQAAIERVYFGAIDFTLDRGCRLVFGSETLEVLEAVDEGKMNHHWRVVAQHVR